MRTRVTSFRIAAVVMTVMLVLLSLAALSPDIVWCHKPDGRVALELAVDGGVCSCQECAHYRREHPSDYAQAFDDGHCVHSSVLENHGANGAIKGNDGSFGIVTVRAGAIQAPAMKLRPVIMACRPAVLQPTGRSPAVPDPCDSALRL